MNSENFSIFHPHHDDDRRLLVLDLDHGKANEMGTRELTAFEALCATIEADPAIGCLCTTSRRTSSSGKPIFIAGANVTEREGWDDTRIKGHVVRQRALMQRLRMLPTFTVALIHGVTLGWGVEYVLACDYTIACAAASFALPETGLGIIPGAGGTAELAARTGPGHALRLGCTGETIDAEEARRIGLVHEVVLDLELGMQRVFELAEQLGRRSPTAVALFKRALLSGIGRPEAERIALESDAYEHCVDSGEARIGRGAFAAIRAGVTPSWGTRSIPRIS